MGCQFSTESQEIVEKVITFVGLDGAGKSHLVFKIANQDTGKPYIPYCTAGVEFAEIPGSTIKIYDTGGLGRYREQWDFYINRSDGVVFVIDRTDTDRMYRVRQEIEHVFQLCSNLQIPILILMNKSDITKDKDDKLEQEHIKQITNVAEFAVDYVIYECSAVSGDGINKSKEWMIQHIKPKRID